MQFKFMKRIKTTPESIFYSMMPFPDNSGRIFAVGRRKYYERLLKCMMLDNEFNVLNDNDVFLMRGEDPRCFYHNDCLYIQDNFWDDMHLINYTTKQDIKLHISGKNISFISHAGRLYFIHFMCPFALYELDLETGEIFPINVEEQHYANYEYRGGTPAYKISDNLYYGFGHRTYQYNEQVLHDVFYWEVDFAHYLPSIKIWNIEQPPYSLNICDPTSVVSINDTYYLITAETVNTWFQNQDYVTKVYEIVW